MSDNKKPRICEVLGVEVLERFKFSSTGWTFVVDENGNMQRYDDGDLLPLCSTLSVSILIDVINGALPVIHLPRWTAEDVEDAKALRRIWPNATKVRREIGNWLLTIYQEEDAWFVTNSRAFSSLKPDETVMLDEILASEDELIFPGMTM
ncbi:MAG: hypothetical protein LUB59_03645 [Candidatus Gastranaerophilales bacterium]|nr:hypothetical protein [Candidatus Gastranaerophilales bacterium]